VEDKMATKHFCDCCGKDTTDYESFYLEFENGWFWGKERAELCKECQKKVRKLLNAFFKNGGKNG